MWDTLIAAVSPHIVAGTLMVVIMGVMFIGHRMWAKRHPNHDALEILRRRLASGEITPEQYQELRKTLTE